MYRYSPWEYLWWYAVGSRIPSGSPSRVFNFRFFKISRNTKRYKSLACFAKISLVSRNKNMRNFVLFRFTLQKLKRNFASFCKNFVSFREILFRFVWKEKYFAAIHRKSRTTFSFVNLPSVSCHCPPPGIFLSDKRKVMSNLPSNHFFLFIADS